MPPGPYAARIPCYRCEKKFVSPDRWKADEYSLGQGTHDALILIMDEHESIHETLDKLYKGRQYQIIVDANDGESYQITDTMLCGTYGAVQSEAEWLADIWEVETGLVVEKITLESHGRVMDGEREGHP